MNDEVKLHVVTIMMLSVLQMGLTWSRFIGEIYS